MFLKLLGTSKHFFNFYFGVKCDLNMQKGNAHGKKVHSFKCLKVYAFESNKLYDVTTDLPSQVRE